MLVCALLMISIASFSNSYKAFDKKKVVAQKGLVGLYEVEGKVYLELPAGLMGRRFLMGTMVEACSDPLESSVGYQPMKPYSVCFEKTQSSIQLRRLNESYVDTDSARPDRNNISSVLKSFKIQEYSSDSTAFLIDVTSYFVSICQKYGKDWPEMLEKTEKEMLQGTFRFVRDGEGGYIKTGIRRIVYENGYSVSKIR